MDQPLGIIKGRKRSRIVADVGPSVAVAYSKMDPRHKDCLVVSREAERIDNPYFDAIVNVARFVAHGLGNPLTGLSLSLELLAQATASSNQKRLVARCERVTGRLTRIKDNLSALGGGMGDPTEEVEPHAFLGEVVVPSLKLPEAYPLAVQVADDVLAVRCHPQLLAEAIAQVVQNAADAMPEGGALGIDVGMSHQDVTISVWDEGPGFGPRALEDAGVRPISTKPQGGGMGLLWSALIIEHIHGGKMQLGRRRRGGAEVIFTLPQLPVLQEAAAPQVLL